jgi:hypothetical protein
MKVTKGSILKVKHSRKGTFDAVAERDFDTEEESFFPVKTASLVEGKANDWEPGESIPCRSSFCTFEVIKAI